MKIVIKLSIYLTLSCNATAYAEVVTDGSVGGKGFIGVTHTLDALDKITTVSQDMGTTAGTNLFHSFKFFNINSGETVRFEGDKNLTNVISRVTGGTVSNIDGTLNSTIGSANFYFINPAGVMFGAHASVNVPAAFHVSTADSLKFTDGTEFSATNPSASTLTIAEPASFGFLGNSISHIVVNGNLAVNPNQTLGIIAGNININNSTINAGIIQLTAKGKNETTVPVNGFTNTNTGNLNNQNGNISLDNSTVSTSNTSKSDAINLFATNIISINNSIIKSTNKTNTETGSITLKANDILINGNGSNNWGDSGIYSVTHNQFNTGKASDIIINATNKLTLQNYGLISSNNGVGASGDITVTAKDIEINGNGYKRSLSAIESRADFGSGNAGNITVIASGNLSILNGGIIDSDTTTGNKAGAITIKADNIILDGNGNTLTRISSNTANTGDDIPNFLNPNNVQNNATSSTRSGSANTIKVTAIHDFSILNGGNISSSTFTKGDAGSIIISAENLTIDGKNNFAGIFSTAEPTSSGHAGLVEINANQLDIANRGVISTSTLSIGDAGSVTINATQSLAANNASINSSTFGGGNAGNVTVTAPAITLDNGSQISSSTTNVGKAGKVIVTANNSLTIDRQASQSSTGIFSTSDGTSVSTRIQKGEWTIPCNGCSPPATLSQDGFDIYVSRGWIADQSYMQSTQFYGGDAGTVSVTTNSLKIDGKNDNTGIITGISSNALGFSEGKAGDVTVNAKTLEISNKGEISSDTHSLAENALLGKAGDLVITATEKIALANQSSISSSTFDAGNAGNVTVIAPVIAIDDATITAQTSASGNAGSVTVSADNSLTANSFAAISSSTTAGGNAGNVTVTAPVITLNQASIKATADNGSSGVAGAVNVTASKSLVASNYASINSATYGNGSAGNVTVSSPDIVLDMLAEISALAGQNSGGQTGMITLPNVNSVKLSNGGKISLQNLSRTYNPNAVTLHDLILTIPSLTMDGGIITTATYGTVDAGNILVTVTKDPLVLSRNAMIRSSTSADGNAGNVTVTAPDIILNSGATITAATTAFGNAGSVTVRADNSLIENEDTSINSSTSANQTVTGVPVIIIPQATIINTDGITTVISDIFSFKASGNAGNVSVISPVIVLNKASINATADNSSSGIAGSVSVTAVKSLVASNLASINSSSFGSGSAGDVTINTPNLSLDNAEISALAGATSSGKTGQVTLQNADIVNLNNGGKISVQNDGTAADPAQIAAHDLVIDVPHLTLNGGIITAATGGNVNAGAVKVTTQNPLVMSNKASINSSTSGSGNAGSVTVIAPAISMDDASITAKTTATGSGGSVTVNVGNRLAATNNASINSSTSGSGKAGNVTVTAPTIVIDNSNISAAATANSSGKTGDVTVKASKNLFLANQAEISIKNEATASIPRAIQAGVITISAPDIDLQNSKITAESINNNKNANVDAGNITINFSHALMMDPSFISTSANLGNGGNIIINGNGLINLQNSGFLTSVTGTDGNGGNINVTADSLLMNNGVIQANAVGGSGGDINLNLQSLILSNDQLIKGGAKVLWLPYQQGFNVIQAASQNGINGAINISSPQFSISGSMGDLNSSLAIPILDSDPCLSETAHASSLARIGKGGIPTNEAKKVFVPAIAEKTNDNLQTQVDLPEQKQSVSNSLIEKETHPCRAISTKLL